MTAVNHSIPRNPRLKKPPEESGGLKYSHEKQKNVIQLKAK
jgi:hypothetical protein